jgi:hypothetical protein
MGYSSMLSSLPLILFIARSHHCFDLILPHTPALQRVVDEDGVVISQLCDEEGMLGPVEFEQAMRKQAIFCWGAG